MNKKLIALAVAAAFAAPVANAAPTVYGIAHVSFDKNELDLANGDTDKSNYEVNGRASRLGVKGSEDLGGGLKAVYKMEFGVGMDSSTTVSSRNQYVGLSGNFGTVVIGRHDTPMKMSTGKLDLFGDEAGDYNSAAGIVDHRAANALAYVSPNFGGATVAVAVVPGEEHDSDAASGTDDEQGNGIADAISAMVQYSAGPLFLAGGYETASKDIILGCGGNTCQAPDDWKAMRLGAGYAMDAFKVGFVYENQDTGGDVIGDRNTMVLSGAFTAGKNVIKAMYAKAGEWSEADDTDHSAFGIGLDHNFSKASKAYVQYVAVNAGDSGRLVVNNGFSGDLDNGGDETILSFGLKTKF